MYECKYVGVRACVSACVYVHMCGGCPPSVFQDVFLFSSCLALCSLPSLPLLAKGGLVCGCQITIEKEKKCLKKYK